MKGFSFLLYIAFFSLAGVAQAQTAWVHEYSKAQELAAEGNKKMLIVFSGSDWCKPCIKLKKEILDTPEFQSAVKEKWVLYNADFPYRKKQDKALVKTNEALAEKYNNKGVFPKVVLVSKEGEVLATAGYKNISVNDYIALIEKQIK